MTRLCNNLLSVCSKWKDMFTMIDWTLHQHHLVICHPTSGKAENSINLCRRRFKQLLIFNVYFCWFKIIFPCKCYNGKGNSIITAKNKKRKKTGEKSHSTKITGDKSHSTLYLVLHEGALVNDKSCWFVFLNMQDTNILKCSNLNLIRIQTWTGNHLTDIFGHFIKYDE